MFIRIGFVATLLLMLSAEYGRCQLFSGKNGNRGSLVSAQQNETDTIKKKAVKTNDSIIIYYFTYDDTTKTKLDSSIHLLHRSPLISEWETDLGNFGSASKTIYFNPSLSPENTLGIYSNTAALYNVHQTKFYNTTKPYSDLYYRIGTKLEQIIEIVHSRNVNPWWNITASYRKAGSPGVYKMQRTNNDNLCVGSNYFSVNQQYKMEAAVLYNKTQQDENGGVESEDYLYYANYNKRLVPVMFDLKAGETNRSNMSNYFRGFSVNLKHEYYFGKKDSVLSIDSSEKIYSFKPQFGVRHVLYTNSSVYKFKDLTPDSTYYSFLGNYSFTDKDSVYTNYFFSRIGNAFSLTGNVTLNKKVMQAEAGYGIEFDHVKNGLFGEDYINNYVFANIIKTVSEEKEWLYKGAFKFYFTGNLIGNILFSAQAGRNFSKRIGQVRIGIDQTIQEPSFMNTEYHTNFYSFTSSTKKETITKLNFTYDNFVYHSSVKLNYYLLANYMYRDTALISKQYANVIPVTQLNVFKQLKIGRFVFDNNLLLQLISTNVPLHLPVFASSSRFAYESLVLKNKLNISTGIDVRYNTAFTTDNYSPLVYGFVTQYNRKIGNVPRCSYFFNFKVKTFRASISLDEIQQLFTRNNINYSKYPGQNFMMRFGFHWMFVN